MRNYLSLLLLILTLISCKHEVQMINKNVPADFDLTSISPDFEPVKELKGQILYLPVYSNVPYQFDTLLFDMSAFVAIHNTDLYNPIQLKKVLYFNQDGKQVDDFLGGNMVEIAPLATKDYYIPYEDKSGTGANFLIEWVSDSLVCEPLIESVTISLKPNNTTAILSRGKVVMERK